MTDIALVADLHGNLPAVEAVDADIRARGIQQIWCLGDVVGKGPSSADTFDWAVSRCQVIVQGNWDEGIGKKLFPKDEFYYRQLGDKRMKALLEFPLEHICTLSGRRIRLFHGRPLMPKALYVHVDDETLLPYFSPDYDVVGYADVHRQGMRIVGAQGIIFNTGSVGNGLGVPMAQYAILRGEWDANGQAPFDVSLVTLPYDRARAIRDAEEAGRRGLVNADLFCREIETGRYARGPAQAQGQPGGGR